MTLYERRKVYEVYCMLYSFWDVYDLRFFYEILLVFIPYGLIRQVFKPIKYWRDKTNTSRSTIYLPVFRMAVYKHMQTTPTVLAIYPVPC